MSKKDSKNSADEALSILDRIQSGIEDDKSSLENKGKEEINNQDNKSEIEELKSTNAKLLKDLEEAKKSKDRLQRQMDNTADKAISKIALEVLDIADALENAEKSISKEDRESNPKLDNTATGIKMTKDQLSDIFTKFSIKKQRTVGEKFNSKFQQAVTAIPNTGQESGIIIEEVQSGYTIGNGEHKKLLRAAKVIVAK